MSNLLLFKNDKLEVVMDKKTKRIMVIKYGNKYESVDIMFFTKKDIKDIHRAIREHEKEIKFLKQVKNMISKSKDLEVALSKL